MTDLQRTRHAERGATVHERYKSDGRVKVELWWWGWGERRALLHMTIHGGIAAEGEKRSEVMPGSKGKPARVGLGGLQSPREPEEKEEPASIRSSSAACRSQWGRCGGWWWWVLTQRSPPPPPHPSSWLKSTSNMPQDAAQLCAPESFAREEAQRAHLSRRQITHIVREDGDAALIPPPPPLQSTARRRGDQSPAKTRPVSHLN